MNSSSASAAGDYRESSTLRESVWNIPEESSGTGGGDGFADLDQIESDCTGNYGADNYIADPMVLVDHEEKVVEASNLTSNPSLSSSSSEDRTEKSTESGAGAASKAKKKGQKRIPQQRFAFMTKSDIDHLEDGYRWRKYGQKAVKNSPFPRSYYRCTNSKCTVKKRVERSCADPSVVITTYEGQHCHHSLGFSRSVGIVPHEANTFARHMNASSSQFYTQEKFSQVTNSPLIQGSLFRETHTVKEASSQPTVDEGLLGDIVPPGIRNG